MKEICKIWMNGNMVISKDALINPGANHFTVLDQNGVQQDVAFMVCSKSNTSNHYGGSGSGPKCNNSSNADNRYVLQMDRSLNVNLFNNYVRGAFFKVYSMFL